jgi:hypothetical protein
VITVWEEDFLGDDTANLSVDGRIVGHVSPTGASWAVFYGAEMIAIRPDKVAAQGALLKYHMEQRAAERSG